MQGVFTKFLQLWIPNKTDKGSVVTDVFEPNFTKLDQNAEATNRTLTNLSNNKLNKGTYSGDAGKLKEDIDEKMDKYQIRFDIRDYDDLITDGFYILKGSASDPPSTNAPYGDPALVQVWSYGGHIYQNAVAYHDVKLQFTRCFRKGVKNTKWERIVNTANYSSMCPYSIGDILLTVSNQNPAVKWVRTTWEKIEGRFLLATSGSNASGQVGGSNTKTIEQANLPNIKLQVDPFSLSVTPPDIQLYNDYAGNSGSGRSTLAIEGSASRAGWGKSYIRINSGGSTGTASPYTSALGSGTALDITPSFYTVHIWKRLT